MATTRHAYRGVGVGSTVSRSTLHTGAASAADAADGRPEVALGRADETPSGGRAAPSSSEVHAPTPTDRTAPV